MLMKTPDPLMIIIQNYVRFTTNDEMSFSSKTKHNITYMEEYFCIDFSICSRVSCLRPDCTVVFPVAGVAENFVRQVNEKLNST